jgi:hypothetical protein
MEVRGWKGCSDVNDYREMDGTSHRCLIVDEVITLFASSGVDVPKSLNPLGLLRLLNAAVFRWHSEIWALKAGRNLTQPEFSPGFCLARRCPNAAFVYVYCSGCIKRRWHVEVKESSLNEPGNGAGLGLFATKEFTSGEYVCEYTWNMKPGKSSMTRLMSSDCSVWTVSFDCFCQRRRNGSRCGGIVASES